MIEVAIMLEGQNGLNWQHWQRIASVVEDCGYAGLFRSDHFTNSEPPDLDSLECWISLTWLASHTRRIEFGPLVSPMSFRHPAVTARMAAAVDDLSGGRLILGLGAGWEEREHTHFGIDLLAPKERFLRFEEGVEVISGLLHSDQPYDFSGNYYQIREGILLPRPARPGGPPILIGGNGMKRTLPLVARFADEWNAVFPAPAEIPRLNKLLDQYLLDQGRQPQSVKRSLAAGCIFGVDPSELEEKVQRRTHGKRSVDELRQRGLVVGTADEIVTQCENLAQSGFQRLMLQWLDLDDTRGIELMAQGILPRLSG